MSTPADDAVHWVGEPGEGPTSLHGNGAGSFARTSGDEDEVTCKLCLDLLARTPADDAGEVARSHWTPTQEDLWHEVANRLGEDARSRNTFDHTDEATTIITLVDEPVEDVARFIVNGLGDWLFERDQERAEARAEVDSLRVTLEAVGEKAKAWIAIRERAIESRYDTPAHHWRGQDGDELLDILAADPVSLADVREVSLSDPQIRNLGHVMETAQQHARFRDQGEDQRDVAARAAVEWVQGFLVAPDPVKYRVDAEPYRAVTSHG